MTTGDTLEILGSLIACLFAFATLMYLALIFRANRHRHSLLVECLTIGMSFIFCRQLATLLVVVGMLGEVGSLARDVARYGLTALGTFVAVWTFVRLAQWQFGAEQVVVRPDTTGRLHDHEDVRRGGGNG